MNDALDYDKADFYGCFKEVPLADVLSMSNNVQTRKLDDRIFRITKTVNEAIKKNSGRSRYSRLKDADIRCQKDRLCMLAPPSSGIGYLTYRDKRYWDFITDLRNEIIKVVDDSQKPFVDTLLVNYAKRYPQIVTIGANPQNKVDASMYNLKSMEVFSHVIDIAMSVSFAQATPDRIKLPNKKITSLGFPYETVDGDSVTTKDLLFGRETDVIFAKTRFLKDWSYVKQGWREDRNRGCIGIFEKQISFIKSGQEINEENIFSLVENQIISVHNVALRENAPDAPINVKPVYKPSDIITGKDRKFETFIYGDDGITGISGEMRTHEINKYIQDYTGMPGACNRQRFIYPSNNMMHTMGTVLANGTLYDIEHGGHGNPSNKEEVVEEFDKFTKEFNKSGWFITVISGDCVNAEVTMASNNELLNVLVPDRFKGYLELTQHSIIPTKNFFRYEEGSYCSAVWYTTWKHITKGNYELPRSVFQLLKFCKIPTYSEEICVFNYSVFLFFGDLYPDITEKVLGDDFNKESNAVRIGPDVWMTGNLATDDMLGRIASKYPIRDIFLEEISKWAKLTLLSLEYGDEALAFGVRMTPTSISVNENNRVSKLVTSERMGFSYKDGTSTFVRMEESGLTSVIDPVLIKHFGYAHSDYATYLPKFESWLEMLGVEFGEVLNEYSPSEKILLGKYIKTSESSKEEYVDDEGYHWIKANQSSSPIKNSARVNDRVVEEMIDILKSTFWGSNEELQRFTQPQNVIQNLKQIKYDL